MLTVKLPFDFEGNILTTNTIFRNDRLSTRPFLSIIEKKWIVYQLFLAVIQCHSVDVCHGDIKTENAMVTSWAWIILTDFASFKPTYLPEVPHASLQFD